jgi:hypothetical protein
VSGITTSTVVSGKANSFHTHVRKLSKKNRTIPMRYGDTDSVRYCGGGNGLGIPDGGGGVGGTGFKILERTEKPAVILSSVDPDSK